MAAFNGYIEAVGILHRLGANINTPNNDGSTPLHTAVRYGTIEVVKKLHALGANINALDNYGQTPVHSIAIDRTLIPSNERTQLILKLCDLGVNLNVKVPLHGGYSVSALDRMVQDPNNDLLLEQISYNPRCGFV